VFTAAGIVLLIVAPQLGAKPGSVAILLRLAEAGLVLLLFSEASRTDLKVLKSIRNLIAMPGIDWYARRIATLNPSAPEFQAAGAPGSRS
jgi:hypothetical protein